MSEKVDVVCGLGYIQSGMSKKTTTFNLRLDKDDRKRLDKVAEELCAPAATAVRILIKREHDRIENEKTTKGKR